MSLILNRIRTCVKINLSSLSSGLMINFNNIKAFWSQSTNPGLLLTWHGHIQGADCKKPSSLSS